MTRGVESGRIARALQQFLDEAARLEAAGLPLTADNPVLRALRADLDDILRAHAALIDGAAEGIGRQGVQAGTTAARLTSLPGVSDAMLAAIGVGWAAPDPEAVAELIRLASSPAWIAELERYRTGVAQDVLDVALRGIVAGRNPLTIAREVAAAVRGMPIARAQSLMRTLQLTSYRRAVGLSYVANQDIVSEHVRIAALDDRCCLACIALHGTRLAVGEAVDDHHNGRCLLPGQHVVTSRGYVPIESVLVGDYVLTHTGRYRRVLRTLRRPYSGRYVEVRAGGNSVCVTPEHPVYTASGWVEAVRLTASSTALTLVSSFRRDSSLITVHPIARRFASRTWSRSRRSADLCHKGSSSIASLCVGNPKSMLYEPMASWGTGDRPAALSASSSSCSCADIRRAQFASRDFARLTAARRVPAALCKRSNVSGSRSSCRLNDSAPPRGSIWQRAISFIKERVLMPSSAVISRYDASSSMYRRLSHGPTDSPIRSSSSRTHFDALTSPAPAGARTKPSARRRLRTMSIVRPVNRATSSASVRTLISSRMSASSSFVQGLGGMPGSLRFHPATIVHHPLYMGQVYDLEVEGDHSFFAEGIAVHNCTSVARIRGLERLTDRIRTGEDWFAGLPEDRQLAIAGPGALELLQSGRATLQDFVMPYTDPVFGQMVREAPLWRVRGGQRVGG